MTVPNTQLQLQDMAAIKAKREEEGMETLAQINTGARK